MPWFLSWFLSPSTNFRSKRSTYWSYNQPVATLGIQSPSENGFMEPKYLAKEVIIHPNHHLTFGDWIPRANPWTLQNPVLWFVILVRLLQFGARSTSMLQSSSWLAGGHPAFQRKSSGGSLGIKSISKASFKFQTPANDMMNGNIKYWLLHMLGFLRYNGFWWLFVNHIW